MSETPEPPEASGEASTEWVNAPVCERCWIITRGVWEPCGKLPTGEPLERLTIVPLPVRIDEPSLEECHRCGQLTIFGVYVRASREP